LAPSSETPTSNDAGIGLRSRAGKRAPPPMNVAALVPAYQAAAHLGEVLLGLQALPARPHVLVVDDGSRDATAEVARQFGAHVHSFAANRGKGHALLAGFERLRDYHAVITLHADGQHPPACVAASAAAAA